MKNADLPAIPQNRSDLPTGLTKREHFAAMAMQGLLSSASDSNGEWTNCGVDNVASEAVMFADALLAELEK